MKGGQITRKEPAPRGSRRNKDGPEPGTLIEQVPIMYDNYTSNATSSQEKYVFRIRRIGDERLSWVHFNHDPALDGNKTDKEFYHLISNILDRVSNFLNILLTKVICFGNKYAYFFLFQIVLKLIPLFFHLRPLLL